MVKKEKTVEVAEVARMDSDIHKLAANGNLELIEKLVADGGVDVNIQDAMGCTPLIWACRGGHVPVLDYFIEKGADVEAIGFGGMRPLHHAANNMKEPVIAVLLKAGANVLAKDDQGNEPLHWSAARGALSQAVLLIDNGGDLRSTNKSGSTPLMKCCISGQAGCAERFLKLQPDCIADKDNEGNTAIHLAARSNVVKVVQLLLKSRADKEAKNKAGKMPIDLVGASFKKDFSFLNN